MQVAVVNRPRGHLAHRDGVQELGLGQPAPAVHQVGLQEGQRHVPAAEDDGPRLQEDQEQGHRPRAEEDEHRFSFLSLIYISRNIELSV